MVPIMRYSGLFIIIFSVFVLAALVPNLFLKTPLLVFWSVGIMVAGVLASPFITAAIFVKKQQRAPDAFEKKELVTGCMFFFCFASIMLCQNDFQNFGRIPVISGMLITFMIVYLMLNLAFGWYARRQATALSEKNI